MRPNPSWGEVKLTANSETRLHISQSERARARYFGSPESARGQFAQRACARANQKSPVGSCDPRVAFDFFVLATTVAAAATASTAAAPIFARLSLVYGQRAATEIFFIQFRHGSARGIVVSHLNEAKAFAADCVAVLNNLRAAYRAECCE